MSIHIEKTTALDASVYVNKFSNEKVIVFTDTNGDKNFIHFGHQAESPLTGNYLIKHQNTETPYKFQIVRVNIDEDKIYLTPQNKNPDQFLSFPFRTKRNDWERIRLDELAL